MLPFADKLYGDADFIFQQDLAPAHTAKGTKSWFSDNGVTVLDWTANCAWPEPHREYLGYCQEEDEIHQTQQCRWHEGCYQSNLGFHYTWAFMQKEAQPSIECIETNILFRSLTFLFKISFFYWSYVIFNFSETLNLHAKLLFMAKLKLFRYTNICK